MPYTDVINIDLSQNRLEQLLDQRLNNKDNTAIIQRIDQRIWDLFGEEWCILFTDLSGFSKHSDDFGIIQFLQTIKESERLFSPIIENFDGFVVKSEGDSLIVIFRSRTKALECVVKMQLASKTYNQALPESEKVILCTGLGWGKILRIPGASVDIFGEEVNFAAKLGEDTAKAGEILITQRLAENFPGVENMRLEEFGYLNNGKQKIFKVLY
ncbi:adenylate/guanylate cyclase domain-containing protein [Alphaproteobacteria bacterium]|nr:adenylate/guanylate cyclase domain-containing protein [Alphaproteobacteria bacterium]